MYLAIAIVAEVVGTSALKASNGFTSLWPSLLAGGGYVVAFYLLSLAVRTLPVGIVYAVWCGIGSVLILLVGRVVWGQTIDTAGLIGIGLIIAGVVVLNGFSTSIQ
jgi:small multidrug resistance pump